MKTDPNNSKKYVRAREKVRQLRVFYVHAVGYVIVVGLLVWNLCIVSGPYADFFTWFNTIFIIAWTIFILLHGWNVYKGRLFFKEKWEERKTQEFMKEQNETIMWE